MEDAPEDTEARTGSESESEEEEEEDDDGGDPESDLSQVPHGELARMYNELADSIKTLGIIQPLTVGPRPVAPRDATASP